MAEYVSVNTSICGYAQCGEMECGVYGIYDYEPSSGNLNTKVEKTYFKISIGDPIWGSIINDQGQKIGEGWIGGSVFEGANNISWSHSLGSDNVSQCSFSLYNYRPNLFDKVEISVYGQTIWLGFVSSYSTKYVGGTIDEGNFTIEFSIECVSRENWLSRPYVTDTFISKTAGSIIKELLWEYAPNAIKNGTIVGGKYYEDMMHFENEQLSSILSRLANASDCYYYLDTKSKFHFLEKYSKKAPLNIDYEMTQKWKLGVARYPTNNYHGTSTSKDSSGIFTVVKIKGVRYHVRKSYFANVDYYIEEKEEKRVWPIEPYLLTVSQKELYTPSQIYDVNELFVTYYNTNPNLNNPTGDFILTTVSQRYYNPYGRYYDKSNFVRKVGRTTLQYEYILEKESSWMIDPQTEKKRKVEISDIDKESKKYWNNVINEDNPWIPSLTSSYDLLSWEALDIFTGKEKFSDLLAIVNQLGLNPAFSWSVSYGGNSMSFAVPYEFNNTEEYQYYIKEGYIEYVEAEPYTYSISSSKKAVYGYRDGSGSAEIEHTVEDSGITSESLAYKYGNELLKHNEDGTDKVSYSHYMKSTDILNKYVRPGQYQNLRLHNANYQLGIESVNYSIISFTPFVVKVDITLATKTKNLEEILARLLRY